MNGYIREIEETNTTKILAVALAVLQNDGFTGENTDGEHEQLSVRKDLHDEGTFSHIQATVAVQPAGKQTRVLCYARRATLPNKGHIKYQDITALDFYEEFFAKLNKGLFIKQEGP